MKIVIFGLSISSSWGNGHATIYRALLRALLARGHDVLFLERDKPWYASRRDLGKRGEVLFYQSVEEVQRYYERHVREADCVIIGSYVPEGAALARWVQATARGLTVFYDIDTPVTLAALRQGDCEYLEAGLVPGFGVYLSFTGGPTLLELEKQWGAKRALAFYCCVDPELYFPEERSHRWELGYLGTYSADRQPALERLLLEPARRRSGSSFIVAGSGYPEGEWPANVERLEHLVPGEHRAFYNSQRFTLNVTRAEMVSAGYSPSVRLFEAAASGCPIISDRWPGIEEFFEPGLEILLADTGEECLELLRGTSAKEACRIGERARQRAIAGHSASVRVRQLECLVVGTWKGVGR